MDDRTKEAKRLRADGLSDRVIADKLGVSRSTARNWIAAEEEPEAAWPFDGVQYLGRPITASKVEALESVFRDANLPPHLADQWDDVLTGCVRLVRRRMASKGDFNPDNFQTHLRALLAGE